MARTREETTSVWQDPALIREEQPGIRASRELLADTQVCVIGAGIAGLTTGYLLQRSGAQVQVIDAAGELCAGETGRTTAHLSSVLDDDFTQLERLFDVSGTRLAVSSHSAAIDCIEAIAQVENIDCDFERLEGVLAATEPAQRDKLDKETDAMRRAAEELQQASHKAAEALYRPQSAPADNGEPKDGEVVDAEYAESA